MLLASHGAWRSAGRKTADALRSNHLNGGTHQGGGTTGSRALHTAPTGLFNAHHSDVAHQFTNTLNQIRPRTPVNQLFSFTRNFVTRLFSRLAAPGVSVPLSPATSNASRSLLQARPITIQSGLSLPVRHALRNNNFRSLGSGTFLPRAPQVPIRIPIASQVGLGMARNYSSARPIFQNLVDNVPIAVRALYEADLDDLKQGRNKKLRTRRISVKSKKATKTSFKGSNLKAKTPVVSPKAVKEETVDPAELDQYFATAAVPAVITQLLIPLAPTPTNRVPLSALDEFAGGHPSEFAAGLLIGSGRFLPLPQISQIHGSHSNHALRVSTLFARLDQANVWYRGGVVCSAYSGPGAGTIRPRRRAAEREFEDTQSDLEGICTVLKVEFHGWTEAEVRGVIGESGKGWCVLEEIWHDEEHDGGLLSATEDDDSLMSESGMSSPAFFGSPALAPLDAAFDLNMPAIDPAQSFVLPTLDFSSSFIAEQKAFAGSEEAPPATSALEYKDPWMEFESLAGDEDGYMSPDSLGSLSISSRSSSFEDITAATHFSPIPSQDGGWSRLSFSARFSDTEPREALF